MNDGLPHLSTEQLSLKALDESYASQVLDFVIRNKSFLEPWEPGRTPEYYTAAYQRRLLAEERRSIEQGQMFKVWMFKKEEPERVIGSISLNNIIRGVFQSCHLGYRTDEQECNRGYMTEGLQAVIAHAFGRMLLHRVEANIMPRNGASLKVVEKLGFYSEGLAKKYLKIYGHWEDHIHMVLRNEAEE